MKIPRLSMLTLGVTDLQKSVEFYEHVLATPANTTYGDAVFFELPGTWIALYPKEKLIKDISADIRMPADGFAGFTLAHNARSMEDVNTIVERAGSHGAQILKKPQETFWGGYSGYFADPDGYCWEIAWGPMFTFSENGELRFTDHE